MEIFQTTKNKRFTTFFVVLFIPFPVGVVVSSMYRNSNFAIFKGSVAGESSQNVTTNGFPMEETYIRWELKKIQ